MSTYENYSETSKYYDKTRVPIGGEILIGVLALSSQPGSELRLLDAGCGTGAYSALTLPHVGHIEACRLERQIVDISLVEGNASMGGAICELLSCHREHVRIDVQGVDVADVRQGQRRIGASAAACVEEPQLGTGLARKCQHAD